MPTTDQKRAIAELSIAREAAVLGVGVLKPLTDGERYDLVFDVRWRLIRVQCKTAVLIGDAVLKIACYSARRTSEGLVKRYYSAPEIDARAAHNRELDRDPSSSQSMRFRDVRRCFFGFSPAETPAPSCQLGGRLRLRR